MLYFIEAEEDYYDGYTYSEINLAYALQMERLIDYENHSILKFEEIPDGIALPLEKIDIRIFYGDVCRKDESFVKLSCNASAIIHNASFLANHSGMLFGFPSASCIGKNPAMSLSNIKYIYETVYYIGYDGFNSSWPFHVILEKFYIGSCN